MSKLLRFILYISIFNAGSLVAMEQDNQPNPYQVLGLSEDATFKQIKRAYRRLALQWHPDRNPNNQEVAERSAEINNAYEQLNRRCAISGCSSNWNFIINLGCTHMVCEDHLAQIIGYESGVQTTLNRNQCPREDCQDRDMLPEDINNIRTQITQRRIERQRPTIDQNHCAFCDRRDEALTITTCGHRICARHFYRDYIQTNNRNCTACQENNIQLILSNLSEDFLEQFRQLERNMRQDRDFGRPGGIRYRTVNIGGMPFQMFGGYYEGTPPLRNSNVCIVCPSRRQVALRENQRINLPTCGHCFCLNCAQERFINNDNRYCLARNCEADIIGMTDEQMAEIRNNHERIVQRIREEDRNTVIGLAVIGTGVVASWLGYKWWTKRKAKKAEQEKKKKEIEQNSMIKKTSR